MQWLYAMPEWHFRLMVFALIVLLWVGVSGAHWKRGRD